MHENSSYSVCKRARNMKGRTNLLCCLKLLTQVQTNVQYDDQYVAYRTELSRIFMNSFKMITLCFESVFVR
jgi:hypothetical protein